MWLVERLLKAEIKTPHSWIRFARIAQAQVCFASTILGSSPCCVTSWAQLRTSSCSAQWMVPVLLDHKYRHYHDLLYQSQSSEDQFAMVLLWDVHLRSWHAHVAVTLFAGCASSVVLWTWAVSFIWIVVGVDYVLCILPIIQRSYHDLWMSSQEKTSRQTSLLSGCLPKWILNSKLQASVANIGVPYSSKSIKCSVYFKRYALPSIVCICVFHASARNFILCWYWRCWYCVCELGLVHWI